MINLYGYSGEETFTEKPGRGAFTYLLWTIQTIVVVSLLAAVVAIGTYLYQDYNNYVDLSHDCYIRINKDILHGNKQTIVDALKEIRNENPEAYGKICRNVKKISESYCYRSDPNNKKVYTIPTSGCFIKGSRTIFVKPDANQVPASVKSRKETILKYTDMLVEYWGSEQTAGLQ